MIYLVKTKYEGYEVSSDGRMRSVDRYVRRSDTNSLVYWSGVELKQTVDNCGYLRADISLGGKKYTLKVHRVVAEAFIDNPNKLPQVNHIDGNKKNNNYLNLEWTDNSGNQLHAIETGLRLIKFAKKALAFTGSVEVYNKDGNLVMVVSGNKEMKDAGLDFRLVSACLRGKRKTHRGFTFKKLKKDCCDNPPNLCYNAMSINERN